MKSPFILVPVLALTACNPTVTIRQEKPIDINVNINGKLELVVHDAKDDLAQIKGEKPRNNVNLDDIGVAGPTKAGAFGGGAIGGDPFPTFMAIARQPGAGGGAGGVAGGS